MFILSSEKIWWKMVLQCFNCQSMFVIAQERECRCSCETCKIIYANSGNVCIMVITDKQFGEIELFVELSHKSLMRQDSNWIILKESHHWMGLLFVLHFVCTKVLLLAVIQVNITFKLYVLMQKIHILKQFTTKENRLRYRWLLYVLMQRYTFWSNSQLIIRLIQARYCCTC